MRNVKSKDEFESDEILFSESNQKIRHFRRSQISEYPSLAIVLASSRPDGLLKIKIL